MATIRVLPDRVANQIAAGEVVERPAAVVKELVENALDAGARRISVEFRHGGRSLIRVDDDGRGMDRDDALLALERHATSKIATAADLDRLGTFGFRGEALPSIASVSQFTLATRREGELEGTEVRVNGGKLVDVRACGRPVGTSVTVAQLFNSVPARRKFLKADRTEAAHVVQCVRLYALAFPGVAFSLVEDGRPVLSTAPCASRADRVAEVHGVAWLAETLPLEAEEGGRRLEGFIGRPGVARATRQEISTFANGRPVDSRTLLYGLVEPYQGLVPPGRYPIGCLFLEEPPGSIDVNVHPTKREVRFRDEPGVRGFVIRSVFEVLRRAGAVAVAPSTVVVPASSGGAVVESWRSGGGSPLPVAVPPAVAGGLAAVPAVEPGVPVAPGPGVVAGPASGIAGVGGGGGVAAWRGWRYLGVVQGGLLAFDTPSGLVLVHPRAAVERIRYEALQAAWREGPVESQRLLLPVPLALEPVTAALLVDVTDFLARHGFEVAPFGRDFFRIEAVPQWMEPEAAEAFLRDALALVRDGQLSVERPEPSREVLARLAARAARAEVPVDAAGALELVSALFSCRLPLTDPEGRPTVVELAGGELARRFHRTSGR